MERSASRPRILSAFGNPALGSEKLNLPGAEREVKRIGRYFDQPSLFLGAEATKEKFLEVAPGSNALHLATHATVDEISPLYSEILLAGPGEGPDVLEAHEIYRLDLSKTDIVTLSACDTGRGAIGRGDEIMGFTRTFLGAGASALLVSLWRVNDASTAQLMDSVYRHRTKEDLSLREALQKAQIELIESPDWAHPAFWAPFILIGDWR